MILTSYRVQFILPSTHAHSKQELFIQVSKLSRNIPLASRHTGSKSKSQNTQLFSVQVHFVVGLSSHTSPGFLRPPWQASSIRVKVRCRRVYVTFIIIYAPVQMYENNGFGFHSHQPRVNFKVGDYCGAAWKIEARQ